MSASSASFIAQVYNAVAHHQPLPLDNAGVLALGCTHQAFFNPQLTSEQRCYLAQQGCLDDFDFVNFFSLCYCNLGGRWIIQLSVVISFILILLIFKFISAVVEEYLAPAISYISEWLNLSEALAAVTLLALANGAGDVITALVASGSSDGLSYNIGSIYGAGFFVTSIVVAMTIMNSTSDIQLEPNSIWRDVGMYILATFSVIIFGMIGQLTTVSAIVMLAQYVLLVLIVWYQDHQKAGEDDSETDSLHDSPKVHNVDIIELRDDKTEEEKQAQSKKWKHILSKINTASPDKKIKLLMSKLKSTVLVMMKMHKKSEEKETTFEEMSTFEKINFIIDLPFDYARKLTLPPCEEKNYSKTQAMVFPAPGILFMIFVAFLQPKLWWLYVSIPVGLLFTAIIYHTSEENKPPKYYILLQVFGAIGALFWTYIISGVLIDLLQFLGMLSKLDKTYLGLTVIAVGNALPDGVTTIALAKQGFAMMGLTGAYAGQLFGLLVGFGLALLRKTIQEGPQPFDLFAKQDLGENLMDIIVIMVSLLNLVMTFVFGLMNKYKFNKTLAKLLGGLYLIFMTTASIIAFKNALASS